MIIDEYKKAFESCDVLISPTAPTPAFRLGENTADPLQMYMTDIMTVPASLAGLPALSIPVATTNAGLPIGMQLVGPAGADYRIIEAAKFWSKA